MKESYNPHFFISAYYIKCCKFLSFIYKVIAFKPLSQCLDKTATFSNIPKEHFIIKHK